MIYAATTTMRRTTHTAATIGVTFPVLPVTEDAFPFETALLPFVNTIAEMPLTDVIAVLPLNLQSFNTLNTSSCSVLLFNALSKISTTEMISFDPRFTPLQIFIF